MREAEKDRHQIKPCKGIGKRNKKKIEIELRVSFPKRYNGDDRLYRIGVIDQVRKLKEKYIISRSQELLKKIQTLENGLIDSPKNYNLTDKNNIISLFDKNFNQEVSYLESMGIISPKTKTVFDYNSSILFFEEKVEREMKAGKK